MMHQYAAMSADNFANGSIHVAGVMDAAEADMLINCGVAFLGVPLVLGYHDEDVAVDQATEIIARHGHRATFFLITYLDTARDVLALCRQLGVSMVQLHGDVTVSQLEELGAQAPDLRVLKSLIVRPDNDQQLAREVEQYAAFVDAFITDTFDPETGATGATGKTHDWAISRRLVELSAKPVILAGGLTADNVAQAIAAVRPAGVDVHTGIEGAHGRKRGNLARRFVAEASAAFADLARRGDLAASRSS